MKNTWYNHVIMVTILALAVLINIILLPIHILIWPFVNFKWPLVGFIINGSMNLIHFLSTEDYVPLSDAERIRLIKDMTDEEVLECYHNITSDILSVELNDDDSLYFKKKKDVLNVARLIRQEVKIRNLDK